MGGELTDLRPGLGEQIGVAINASVLVLDAGHETPLERVAALGYARAELMGQAKDAKARIAAELAPLLWRAKYGHDGTATVRAVELLKAWCCTQPLFAELELADPGVVLCFAAQVMDEWCTQRCPGCGGSGWQEITRRGKRIRPQGRYRNDRHVRCEWCAGTGRRKISDVERRRALGGFKRLPNGKIVERRKVHVIEYDMLWRRQFRLLARDVQRIATSVRDPLMTALGRTVAERP